jgi:hypothetical protein
LKERQSEQAPGVVSAMYLLADAGDDLGGLRWSPAVHQEDGAVHLLHHLEPLTLQRRGDPLRLVRCAEPGEEVPAELGLGIRRAASSASGEFVRGWPTWWILASTPETDPAKPGRASANRSASRMRPWWARAFISRDRARSRSYSSWNAPIEMEEFLQRDGLQERLLPIRDEGVAVSVTSCWCAPEFEPATESAVCHNVGCVTKSE